MNSKNKQDWQTKKLGNEEVFSVDYGTRVVRSRDGGTKYDVYGGGGKTFFMDIFNRKDELVVARFAMSEKCTRFVKGKFFLNDSGLTVSIKNKKEIIQEYLNHYFIFLNDYIYSLGRGSAQRNLDVKKFKEIKISFPKSLAEQKRIVGILDGVFADIEEARENAEKNLENAKEFFESYLESIFNNNEKLKNKNEKWGEKKLGEVCDIKSKLIDPKEKEFLELVHIGAGNIVSNKEELVKLKTAREEKLISGKFLFDDSVVLYSKIRPYLKKIVRPSFDGLCSADIYPLSVDVSQMSRDFLYYILLSNRFTKYAIKGSGRAGMPKVNRKHLFNFVTLFPKSLKTQKRIVKKLDELSGEMGEYEAILRSKIDNLDELKKSILEKAFNGEL